MSPAADVEESDADRKSCNRGGIVRLAQAAQAQNAPPFVAKVATPINPAGWVTNNDYPKAARKAGEQGMVLFHLDIDRDGKVTACTVTRSSGSARLDERTCSLMMARGRFTPAKDAAGNRIPASYNNRVNWRL
jgi:protein TonB